MARACAVAVSLLLVGCTADPVGAPSAAFAAEPERPTAAGSFLAARHAERERDWDGAARFLEQALALEPTNFDLLQRAHAAVLADGRFADAVALARRIVAVSSANPPANVTLAVEEIGLGRWEDAGRRIRELPLQGINRVVLPLMRAWIEAGLDRPAAAQDQLRGLGEIGGFRPIQMLHAALINDLAGRTAEADADFTRALETEGGPPPRVAEAAAWFYAFHGRREEARALIARVRALYPDSLSLEAVGARLAGSAPTPRFVADAKAGMAEALFNVASAVRQEAGGQVSLAYGRYALAIAPDHGPALLLVADVLDQQNRFAESNALFAKVPASDPLSWPARLRIAENLYQLKKPDEAVAMLEAMASERPDRIDALTALGQIRRLQERFPEAAEVYARALARIPDPQPRHWALFYARGIAHERSKQWPAAEADFLKALELQPEQPDVMNYLAYSWVDMNLHLDRAFPMLERAVELRPNSGHIIDSLAWAHFRKDRFEEAVPLMERAAELLPQDPVILDHLGDVYWRVGRTAEARFSWRRSLANKPEGELRAELERKIAQGLAPTPQARR